jgi:hypothetical protein
MSGLPEGFSLQFAVKLPDGRLYSHPVNGHPFLWIERAAAELMLERLGQNAHDMGIRGWQGTVVWSYCSPFVDYNAQQLVDELQAWLQQQTGGTP